MLTKVEILYNDGSTYRYKGIVDVASDDNEVKITQRSTVDGFIKKTEEHVIPMNHIAAITIAVTFSNGTKRVTTQNFTKSVVFGANPRKKM